MHTDKQALREYRSLFSRAALEDPSDYGRFEGILDQLIALLNTGTVEGKPISKRGADFLDPSWRAALDELYHKIRGFRLLSGVRSLPRWVASSASTSRQSSAT